MKRLFAMLVAVVAVVTTSACGGSSSDGAPVCNTASPLYAQIQGTWASCIPQGAGSMKNTIAVSGCNVTVTNNIYSASVDCTGAFISVPGSAVVTIGNPLQAPMTSGPTPVYTAYQIDIIGTVGGQSIPNPYTIGYVSSDTPARLYVGAPIPPLDGNSPQARPNVLSHLGYFTKQP